MQRTAPLMKTHSDRYLQTADSSEKTRQIISTANLAKQSEMKKTSSSGSLTTRRKLPSRTQSARGDNGIQLPASLLKSKSDRYLQLEESNDAAKQSTATKQDVKPELQKTSSSGSLKGKRKLPSRTQSARVPNPSASQSSALDMRRVSSTHKLPSRSNSHRVERDRIYPKNATFTVPAVLKTARKKSIGDSETTKRREIRRTQSARSTLAADEASDGTMGRPPSTGSMLSKRTGLSRNNSERSKTMNATFTNPIPKVPQEQVLFNMSSSSHSQRSRKQAPQTKTKTQKMDSITQDPSWTPLYLYARQADWKAVSQQCNLLPRDAKCVDPTDGTTALHLAVISRTNPTFRNLFQQDTPPAPLELIEELAAACPEAGIIRCHLKLYTPLCYACSVYEREYSMQNAKIITRILLEHAPQSAYVFTDDGMSALDIHILTASRLFTTEPTTDTTIVLKTLLDGHPRLAKTRCFKDKVRGPIEILYRSNREKFKNIASKNESPDSWWAWKLVHSLLRNCSETSRVNILHAAAGLNGCPVAILKIAAQNCLEQLSQAVDDSENTPLHDVCMWIDEQNEEETTEFINQRKREAIQCLLRLNSKASRTKNVFGETPLQLAVESQTPYERGIQALVRANPGALCVPRSLRFVEDENDKLLSVDLYNDNESIDSEWENPVLAVEGMYPFMVAAVVAVEPATWRSREIHLDDSAPDRTAKLTRQNLASLDTIYGLLRAKPSMLGLYKPVYVELDFSETEEYTDEYVEESESEYTEVTQED